MIVCDKCGSQIEDATLSPGEESDAPEKSEDGKKKRYYKKDQAKEELPMKRPSLVTMPYFRAVNGYVSREIDLCEVCREALEKRIEKVKFDFLTGGS